jgi:hypothetical protein
MSPPLLKALGIGDGTQIVRGKEFGFTDPNAVGAERGKTYLMYVDIEGAGDDLVFYQLGNGVIAYRANSELGLRAGAVSGSPARLVPPDQAVEGFRHVLAMFSQVAATRRPPTGRIPGDWRPSKR